MSKLKSRLIKIMSQSVAAELSNTYTLSSEQLKFYQNNGYLVIKNLIDFGSLYNCKRRFIQICNGIVPKGHIVIVREKRLMGEGKKAEDYVNKIQDILFDEVFSTYIEDRRLLSVVSSLVGDDVTAMHSMLINKPPGTAEHPPHQDMYYFPFRPAEKIVAAWTAIDEVTIENGCLYVVPGSHNKKKLYEHGYNKSESLKMYHGIQDPSVAPSIKRVYLEMSPGDTVFFHPFLVHGSGPNVSKNYRKSISCHYANSHVTYVDVTGSVQEPIAKEIEDEARRRGLEVSFQDAWRLRSKLVKGKSHL